MFGKQAKEISSLQLRVQNLDQALSKTTNDHLDLLDRYKTVEKELQQYRRLVDEVKEVKAWVKARGPLQEALDSFDWKGWLQEQLAQDSTAQSVQQSFQKAVESFSFENIVEMHLYSLETGALINQALVQALSRASVQLSVQIPSEDSHPS
jgi:hypothetical protein